MFLGSPKNSQFFYANYYYFRVKYDLDISLLDSPSRVMYTISIYVKIKEH